MRTFKEVKEAMIKDRINTISHNERELENDNLMNYQKDELREKIKNLSSILGIGAEVNTAVSKTAEQGAVPWSPAITHDSK